MPQIDRLLSAMVSSKAHALTLDEGDQVKLEFASGPRPVTQSALTAQQVISLLKEVAPPDAARHLDEGRASAFTYAWAEGSVAVRAAVEDGKWRVRVRIETTRVQSNGTPVQSNGCGHPGAGPGTLTPIAVPAQSAVPVPSRPTGPAPGRPSPARAGAADAIRAFGDAETARAAIERLLRTTVEQGASDLHLRCGEPPILRRHGDMKRIDESAPLENDELTAMLWSIMPERNRHEFGETNDTDFAHEIEGCARFRANALKDRKGAAAVFRQIPSKVVSVEDMNVSPEVQRLCYLTKGLVLVTGPTGSGKSTTLCALIDLVNRERSDHIITIEDPIEFVHPNKRCIITQRQVGVHTKTFKSALRAALREDPDIILVGELRDLETVSIAIETAETGHLVFGTLHTSTAPSTVDRLIDQFPADRQEQIRVMLSESLKGVISQTLCKKVGGGRVAAREILLTTPAISNLIREGKTFQIPSVLQTSRKLGMITLNDALADLVDGGLVEPKEAYMKAVDKASLVTMLKARGHDMSFLAGADPSSVPAKAPPAAGAGAARK